MNPYIDVITEGLKRYDRVRTIFSGRSMLPTLKQGMQLLVEDISPSSIRPSDIIMYRCGDGIVAHRVIKIISKSGVSLTFVTKGDNHAYIDCSYVPQADIMGIVRAAFTEKYPGRDVLVKSRFVGSLYTAVGNIVLVVRARRDDLPPAVRSVLKYFVGGTFFIFKKFIHIIYMGMYHVKLFSGKFHRGPGDRQVRAGHGLPLL